MKCGRYIQTMGCYSESKRDELRSHEKTWGNLNMSKGKKPIWKGHILYDSKYMASAQGKSMKAVKRSVASVGGREG